MGTPNYPRDFGTTLAEMRRLATAAFSSGNARAALRKILAQTFTVAGDMIVQGGGRILAYAADSTEIVNINTADGTVSMIGQLSSGVDGDRVVVNPAGSSYPEIRFYPALNTDLFTMIRSRSDVFGGEATLQMRAGIDPVTDAETSRVTMSSGIFGSTILDASGDYNGGHLDVAQGYVELAMFTGPDLSSGSRSGGRYYGSPTFAEVGFWDGVHDNRWFFGGTNGRADLYGKLPDFVDLGAGNCLFTGHVAGTTGAVAQSVGYGTTSASIRYPLVSINDGPAKAVSISSNNTGGFTVAISPAASGAWNMYYFAFRV